MYKFSSHSQHADDYIAWQLLGKKKEGIVVEVGAFDGRHLSNSYSFGQLGWQSICIEPSPEIFKYLVKNRPDAKNINCAVVGDEAITEIDFYSEEIGVLSGCNFDAEDVKRRYANRGITYKEPQRITVKAKTLTAILDENLPAENTIDIVSIDVEGFEIEVLKGLNLGKYVVNLFIVEANSEEEKEKIFYYFKALPHYIFVGNNVQNLFFVRKRVVKKSDLRYLKFDTYIKAKQIHPKGKEFLIDSTPPRFEKSKEALRFEKILGFI